ncbi:hypothetical protein K1719_030646 [Acacia pycnantha]|nr:hypothetical protein K1719_030646 [Acacia pycnantha]
MGPSYLESAALLSDDEGLRSSSEDKIGDAELAASMPNEGCDKSVSESALVIDQMNMCEGRLHFSTNRTDEGLVVSDGSAPETGGNQDSEQLGETDLTQRINEAPTTAFFQDTPLHWVLAEFVLKNFTWRHEDFVVEPSWSWISRVLRSLSFDNIYIVNHVGRGGGLLLGVCNPGSCKVLDQSSNWFYNSCTFDDQEIYITFVDDFPFVSGLNDKFSCSSSTAGAASFRNLFNECSLIDVPSKGGWFTWPNNQKGSDYVMEKLD